MNDTLTFAFMHHPYHFCMLFAWHASLTFLFSCAITISRQSVLKEQQSHSHFITYIVVKEMQTRYQYTLRYCEVNLTS